MVAQLSLSQMSFLPLPATDTHLEYTVMGSFGTLSKLWVDETPGSWQTI